MTLGTLLVWTKEISLGENLSNTGIIYEETESSG